MHLSSAALLLLLVPATRAAAIPAQGGVLGGDKALVDSDKLANGVVNSVLGGGHVVGPATVKRDESTNLLGTVMEAVDFGKTVSDVADKATGVKILQRDEATDLLDPVVDAVTLEKTVSDVAEKAKDVTVLQRDEDAVALANNIRKLSYEQLGQLARLLKILSGGVSTTSKRSAAFNPADLKIVVDIIGDLTNQLGGYAKSKRSAPLIPEEMRNELSLLITGKPFDEQTNDVDAKRDITGTEVAGAIAYAEKLAAGPAGQLADLQNGSPLGSIGRRQAGITSTVPTVAAKAAEAVVDVSLKVVDTVPGVGKSRRGEVEDADILEEIDYDLSAFVKAVQLAQREEKPKSLLGSNKANRDTTSTDAIAEAEKLAAAPAGQAADLQNGSPLASTVSTVADNAADAVVGEGVKLVGTVPGVGKSRRGELEDADIQKQITDILREFVGGEQQLQTRET